LLALIWVAGPDEPARILWLCRWAFQPVGCSRNRSALRQQRRLVAVIVGPLDGIMHWRAPGILGRIGPWREQANAERFLPSEEAVGAMRRAQVGCPKVAPGLKVCRNASAYSPTCYDFEID
jgi:hypothetical protein